MPTMERFSYISPISRLTDLTVSTADRLALQRTSTSAPPHPGLAKWPYESTDELPPVPRLPSRVSCSTCSYGPRANEPPAPATQATAIPFRPGTRFYLAFAALSALALVVALNGTTMSVAMPAIANAVHGSTTCVIWAMTAFLIASTVFQPVYTAFSESLGSKNLALLSVLLLLAGTLATGFAKDMTTLLVGRSIQGIGAGGVTALTAVLVNDLIPLQHRGQWIGTLGAVWTVGSTFGPVLGGALASDELWHWMFLVTLPLIAASFVSIVIFCQAKPSTTSFVGGVKEVDWVGSTVFVASIISILVPLTWGGVTYEWSSWRVLTPMGCSAAGFIILFYHERYVANQPIIRGEIFANRTANIAYITTAIHGMILWTLLYYQPLYTEGVRSFRPVVAGVALFPTTFTIAPMAIATGLAIGKLGRWRWSIWSGWGVTVLGTGMLCALDTNTQIVQVVLTDLILGVGLGSLFPALQYQLQSATMSKHLASAVAMFSFSRALGQTLGVAISGNVFQNALSSRLAKEPLFADRAQELAKHATDIVQWLQTAQAGDEKAIMRQAFTDSIRVVYIGIAALAVVATFLSICIQHYNLDRPMDTEQYVWEEPEDKQSPKGILKT
ncbi:hypothetical protein LTR86_010850 [Recurvomyces mirabilis]|nr:hypothetical protein LTR86_010850 [Recurvomyces mirabilis]